MGMYLYVYVCIIIGSKLVCVYVLSSILWVVVYVCMNNYIFK